MNTAFPKLLHCINSPVNLAENNTSVSVLDRQSARLKWPPEQFNQRQCLNGNDFYFFPGQAQAQQFEDLGNNEMGLLVNPDPGLDNGWRDMGHFGGGNLGFGSAGFGNEADFGMGSGVISRTMSCPPVAAVVGVEEKQSGDSVLVEKMMVSDSGLGGRESFKKREADKNPDHKGTVTEGEHKEKKKKVWCEEGDSKITEQNSNNQSKITSPNKKKKENSGDNSKTSEVQKPDYIHVRARRGQATDSHSLAERLRREKISERMKYLQDLVPGCNKITGKAGMLDEIINYVQSLQRQVEFLSMRLAAVNPTLDFSTENFFPKEACIPNFPVGVSPEITNPGFVQLNPFEQLASCNGFEVGLNSSDLALLRTISAPGSIPETFLDSSVFNQHQSSSNWEPDLQSHNNYGTEFFEGRSTSLPSDQFPGPSEVSTMKMAMM